MRKTSMVLGIIGSAIAFALTLIFIIISVNFRGIGHTWLKADELPPGEVQVDSGVAGEIAFLAAGGLAFVAGALGLAGSLIVNRKHVASGVMMIAAAVLCLFSYYNVVSMILFITGAVFALRRPRKTVPPR